MSASRPMNAQEWALLLALSVIWGGSFYFIAIAVTGLPPFTIVFLRVAIGAVGLLALLAIVRQGIPLHAKALIAFAGMGILNNVIPQTLIVWAQMSLPSGYASILNATTPFFTVLILNAFTDNDRATPAKWIGVLIGFAGVATMIGLDRLSAGSTSLLPPLAILGAAFCYGLSSLWGRRFAALGIRPLAAATGQLCASTIILAPISLLIENPLALPAPSAHVWMAVVALALICTSLAYLIFFRIFATAGGSNLSLVTFLIPVSAIALGILLLGEQFHARHALGMAMIGLGLACIDGRPLARLGLLRAA